MSNVQAQIVGQTVDENGQPFIILREQEKQQRIKGVAALRVNIAAAKALADTVRSSLGPKGMDKIVVDQDGGITVTNDGATIMDKICVENATARLLVDLSKSQDAEIGDGTTGIVLIAGSLLEQALRLLDKRIHPLCIADGFEKACEVAVGCLERLATSDTLNIASSREKLIEIGMTALGSKVVSSCSRQLAEIAVDAVMSVADLERKDVNFDLIKIESKVGGKLEDTQLIEGIVLDKEFAHPQMPKEVKDAKIALLTCPFEPPKPKTKHKLDITTNEAYKAMVEIEQQYFKDMLDQLEAAGTTLAICQWGFDDEATHLLYQRNLPAIRWVGGVEIELLAIATGARIVPRFSELTPEKLGHAGAVREISLGTDDQKFIVVEKGLKSGAVTVVIRGGNDMIVSEAKRSLHDAICCIRNFVRDDRTVPGGGASEMAMSAAIRDHADMLGTIHQYAVRAFSVALDVIPQALSENSGIDAIGYVAEVKARQLRENNPYLGVNCMGTGSSDMRTAKVSELFASKSQQIRLATQVVKMILKIDDVMVMDQPVA